MTYNQTQTISKTIYRCSFCHKKLTAEQKIHLNDKLSNDKANLCTKCYAYTRLNMVIYKLDQRYNQIEAREKEETIE